MLGGVLLECFVPLMCKLLWDGPAMLSTAEAHSNEMASCRRRVPIDKAFTAMEDRKVVNKVDVSSLRLDFHLGGLGDRLDGIQGLDLAGCQ